MMLRLPVTLAKLKRSPRLAAALLPSRPAHPGRGGRRRGGRRAVFRVRPRRGGLLPSEGLATLANDIQAGRPSSQLGLLRRRPLNLSLSLGSNRRR